MKAGILIFFMNDYILLVDDDVDDQYMFLNALSEIDVAITCHTVNNGRECISFLEQNPASPAIIFSDMNMPLMNGEELTIYLKKHPGFSSIPIALLSTAAFHHKEKLLDLGVGYIIKKPTVFSELKTLIKNILAQIQGN